MSTFESPVILYLGFSKILQGTMGQRISHLNHKYVNGGPIKNLSKTFNVLFINHTIKLQIMLPCKPLGIFRIILFIEHLFIEMLKDGHY